MPALSKILPYTCYELGHTWHHSCSRSSFEIFIVGVAESLKIYGVVYFVSTLIQLRKLKLGDAKKILKQYLQSVIFLSINAFGYIGSFCVIRHIFRHVNVITASYLPGFVGSLMAILIERTPRRVMNAIYVTNVASECVWNQCVDRGWFTPIPRGEVLIFAGSMAVLGYFYHSSTNFSPFINSIMKLLLGKDESGNEIEKRKEEYNREEIFVESGIPYMSMTQRMKNIFNRKHISCLHNMGCIHNFIKTGLIGASQGFAIQFLLNTVFSIGKIINRPSTLKTLLLHKDNFGAAAYFSWFAAFYKGVCCLGRHISGDNRRYHGAIAGFLGGLSMYFYSSPSIAVYIFWKTIEALYEKGCDDGILPRIPGSIEFLYSLSTGYLFHMAALEQHNMKPSYWTFLMKLTSTRMAEYNHHLLGPYGLDSARNFPNQWPSYDKNHITKAFADKFAQQIELGRPL